MFCSTIILKATWVSILILLLLHQALTKFLKCVNWDLPQEAKQALELLGKWRPMDVEDSLELLSSQFANPTVRRYAVARLQQADDEVGGGGRRRTRRSVYLCRWRWMNLCV